MAADSAHWKRVIFSTLLTALAGPIGAAELHCRCVVRGDSGLLLAGGSGAGKSTLALAQVGCAFLADDRSWVS
jgi:serine kinase of HPr protein (carbohydrate metabolism regulator)